MIRIIFLLFWILLLMLPVILIGMARISGSYKVYRFFYKFLAHLLRLRISVSGKPTTSVPTIFVSNHVSYMDILVLGSVLPGYFVSKAEVAKWPVIGWLGRFNGTVYINRKTTEATNHLEVLENALEGGKNLILFPEGTTSDGKRVLPFKSSLFKLAEDNKITVQPITITYTHINGLPIQTNERTKVAWIGEAEFAPHFKELISMGIIRVKVTIHDPITEFTNRKDLALKAHSAVESGL